VESFIFFWGPHKIILLVIFYFFLSISFFFLILMSVFWGVLGGVSSSKFFIVIFYSFFSHFSWVLRLMFVSLKRVLLYYGAYLIFFRGLLLSSKSVFLALFLLIRASPAPFFFIKWLVFRKMSLSILIFIVFLGGVFLYVYLRGMFFLRGGYFRLGPVRLVNRGFRGRALAYALIVY